MEDSPPLSVDWQDGTDVGIAYTRDAATVCCRPKHAIKLTAKECYRRICENPTSPDFGNPAVLRMAYPRFSDSDVAKIFEFVRQAVSDIYTEMADTYKSEYGYDMAKDTWFLGQLSKKGLDLRHNCSGCLVGAYNNDSWNEEPESSIVMYMPCQHIVCKYPCYEMSDSTKCLTCKHDVTRVVRFFPKDYFERNLETLVALVVSQLS